MKRCNYYFDETIIQKLQTLSQQTGISTSKLIREAIVQFLSDPKIKVDGGWIRLYSTAAGVVQSDK